MKYNLNTNRKESILSKHKTTQYFVMQRAITPGFVGVLQITELLQGILSRKGAKVKYTWFQSSWFEKIYREIISPMLNIRIFLEIYVEILLFQNSIFCLVLLLTQVNVVAAEIEQFFCCCRTLLRNCIQIKFLLGYIRFRVTTPMKVTVEARSSPSRPFFHSLANDPSGHFHHGWHRRFDRHSCLHGSSLR